MKALAILWFLEFMSLIVSRYGDMMCWDGYYQCGTKLWSGCAQVGAFFGALTCNGYLLIKAFWGKLRGTYYLLDMEISVKRRIFNVLCSVGAKAACAVLAVLGPGMCGVDPSGDGLKAKSPAHAWRMAGLFNHGTPVQEFLYQIRSTLLFTNSVRSAPVSKPCDNNARSIACLASFAFVSSPSALRIFPISGWFPLMATL